MGILQKDNFSTESTSTSITDLRERTTETPWKYIYISIGVQFIIGVEISIYFMSAWPYLSELDPKATMGMLGWIIAACSFGCSLANPLFGAWNQRTMAVTNPACFGMFLAATGQCIYGLLPVFPDGSRQWVMMSSRLITGLGAGSLSVLRAYLSMASTADDRLRTISIGTAGYVLGLSLGPVVQAIFTPIGDKGFKIGHLVFNMYTIPAFSMVLLSLGTIVVLKLFFREVYAGVLDQKKDEETADKVKIPKFDVIPALVCIYLWMVINSIATLIEVISTPLSTALYNWKDSQSVSYNAIFQACSCFVSVSFNLVIGYTRIGNIDKRVQVIMGLFSFVLYFVCCYPWPFYAGPLDYIPQGLTTADVGGCEDSFTWCEKSVRIPLALYVFSYIVFYGIAFPFATSPSGTLFSEILGPRRQGTMQGLYSLGGSFAQFCTPIVATTLFEHSGYRYIMIWQFCAVSIGILLMVVFYRRLVPLEVPSISQDADSIETKTESISSAAM